MTNKTVEAVARAICACDPNSDPDAIGKDIHNVERHSWEMWEEEARAAIKAHTECLMEPSEEMVEAGALELCDGSSDPVKFWHAQARDVWRDMLSAQEKTP